MSNSINRQYEQILNTRHQRQQDTLAMLLTLYSDFIRVTISELYKCEWHALFIIKYEDSAVLYSIILNI